MRRSAMYTLILKRTRLKKKKKNNASILHCRDKYINHQFAMFVVVLVPDRIRTHHGGGGDGGVRDLNSLVC